MWNKSFQNEKNTKPYSKHPYDMKCWHLRHRNLSTQGWGVLRPKICVGACLHPATVGNSSIRVCEPYLPLLVTVIVVFRQGLLISRWIYVFFWIYSLLMFIIFTVCRRTFYNFIYKHMYLRTSTQWSVSTQLVWALRWYNCKIQRCFFSGIDILSIYIYIYIYMMSHYIVLHNFILVSFHSLF